ncbi:MAG TPA: alpha/beta hydrolase [Verrucomicrobiae bacterium]|nr:alpha/beta hydrolase [Verrucomicrobiae bacterium]
MDSSNSTALEKGKAQEPSIRVYNRDARPTLIYLPGVHGDWTLVTGFRRAVGTEVCFVEITYPRTVDASLDDYAAAIEGALTRERIQEGWLLGESFGSQVVWEILRRGNFQANGVILAGGFGRHPAPWMASAAMLLTGRSTKGVLNFGLQIYALFARFRFRRSPETLASIREFVARRTGEDWKAMRHRFELVAQNDPRPAVRSASLPIYALTGFFDPIVPWAAARRALLKDCPRLKEHRVIWPADHNVLGTAPAAAAKQILSWIKQPGPGRHRPVEGLCPH